VYALLRAGLWCPPATFLGPVAQGYDAAVKTPVPRRGAPAVAGLVVVALVLEAAYALFILWPMRICSRPVSPHVHLVGTFGVDRGGALRYMLTVAVLFALYGLALWLVVRRSGWWEEADRPGGRLSLWPVLGGAVLFCATLVPTHPLSSTDLFNYMAGARIAWVHHDNPLTVPPLAYPGDRFVMLVLNWRDIPSPYGPLWMLVSGLPLALGGGRPLATVIAFKATAAAFLLGTGLLAAAVAARLRPGSGPLALLAFTWNPLAVWHAAGNGHNDAVMVFFLALAAFLLARGLPGPALVALTASALVKFATLLLLPLLAVWWWRGGCSGISRRAGDRHARGQVMPWLPVCALLVVLAYAPFWQGWDTFRAALDEGSYFTVSFPAVLRGALTRVFSVGVAEMVSAWTGRAAFLAVYAALLWRLNGRGLEPFLATAALVLGAYLLLAATYFAPWYVLWPFSLAAMVPWRREVFLPALALTLTAMSVLLWATWVRARFAADPLADWYPMHLLTVLSVVPLPVAVWWATRREAGRVSKCPRASGAGRGLPHWR